MADKSDIRTILRQEIGRKGAIPFSQFMEIALYCPKTGYYERPEGRIGRAGDYYTSVSVGSLFGELLAFQFAEWLQAHGDARVQIVEAGAHDGRLAEDILNTLLPTEISGRLEYWIVEPSAERQKWQRERLDKFAGKVKWTDTMLPTVEGIVFSNELLDAMPVRRFGWDAKREEWFEWGVAVGSSKFQVPSSKEDEFVWARMTGRVDVRESGLEIAPELEAVLPDEFAVEFSPGAVQWWRAAAKALRKGRLMTLDYGFSAEEFLVPERLEGTLRAYSRHGVSNSLLANPGEQDLTAHVNFSQIQREGERCGLTTATYESQRAFLARIAERRGIRADEVRQFQTLTHPEHLGDKFRVLVQERNCC